MITQERHSYMTGRFDAMHCPCEILLDTTDASLVSAQLEAAVREAQRIEEKYSRYRRGNIVDLINTSGGKKMEVDPETAALLDYAAKCHELSDGLFDITTGVLREIWRFEAQKFRSIRSLSHVRERIGWEKVTWKRPFMTLPSGFQIDLGGICKEYAADRILEILRNAIPWPRWSIWAAISPPQGSDVVGGNRRGEQPGSLRKTVPLRQGGWPPAEQRSDLSRERKTLQPHPQSQNRLAGGSGSESVTVAAKTCTEAGFWSTLAVLHGDRPKHFSKNSV